MSWRISLVKNTVTVSPECAEAVFQRHNGSSGYWPGADDIRSPDGKLWFNPDWMEWMDYLDNEGVRNTLCEFRAEGVARFADAEGDQAGQTWEYVFTGGEVKMRRWNTADAEPPTGR